MNRFARPFTDEHTGNLVQDGLASFLVRAASAVAGGTTIVALLAVCLSRQILRFAA